MGKNAISQLSRSVASTTKYLNSLTRRMKTGAITTVRLSVSCNLVIATQELSSVYGKIFVEIFDSTLADFGGDTIYVFIAMVIKSDANGYLKMTPSALARTIAKPIDTVQKAIENLEKHDPDSNDPDHQGRRIIPMRELTNGEKNRGWWVVNKQKYILKGNPEDRKQQNREAQQRFRAKSNNSKLMSACVSSVSTCNQDKPVSAHKDKDKDKDININPLTPFFQKIAFSCADWIDIEAWRDFAQHVQQQKKPVTDLFIKKNLEILQKYPTRQIEIVNNMIRGNWDGLAEPRMINHESKTKRVIDKLKTFSDPSN